MNTALVVYDATGKIWSINYGAEEVPQGIPAIFVDVPDGASLDCIDITDPANPVAVFTYLPESDLGKLQNRVSELEVQLTDTQIALCEQYEANLVLQEEVTNTQLALCELYEQSEEVV